MFVLDFTKPYMYANTIAFYQGNLSTNNTLRCKLKTGSVEDLTGYACTATFYVNGVEIVETCKIIDRASCIVDVVLPSNALVAGEHKMEVILTKPNVSTVQSPMLKYEVWQGLTTGEGIEGTAEYPVLVELINNTQQAIDKTNELQTEVKASLVLANDEIEKIPGKVQQKVDEITSNIDPLIQDIEKNEEVRQANEAERIKEEDIRKANERARIDAELVREHNDADHEKAEAVRQTNEENRRVAEEGRVEAEKLRVKAESDRVVAEDRRVQSENKRQENYDFMAGDEERRRLEENKRIEAEKVRVASESDRIAEENNRRTVEASRVKAEETRVSSENTRVANEETRKTQETQRVQAETDRATKYDKLVQDTNASIDEFNTFTTQAKTDETTRKRNETNRLNAERDRREAETAREASEGVRNRQEDIRVARDENRENVFNSKVSAMDAKIAEGTAKISEVNTAKNTMVSDTKQAIDKMKKDFNSLSASQQQDTEVILARDGEESLNARLERDLFIGDKSLKQEVIDLGGLIESQDMSYATDKGYLVCTETKKGTVKDLKISGKSLKNVCAKRDFTIEGDGAGLTHDLGTLTEPIPNDVEYTVIVKVPSDLPNKNCFFSGYDKNGNGKVNIFNGDELYNNKGGILVKKVTNAPTYDTPLVDVRLFTNATTGTFKLNDVMVIVGDYTQNPPNSYFEGIASVGNGVDKIEVSSMNNGNILNSELIKGGVNSDNGQLSISSSGSGTITQREIMPVLPNMKLYYKSTGERTFRGGGNTFLYKYDKNNNYIGRVNYITFETIEIPSDCYGVRVVFTDFELSKDYPADKYGVVFSYFENFVDTPAKQDKKPILFKDTDGTWKPIKELRGLDTVCDTIELHSDGKYYYHQRTDRSVLDGSEDEQWLPYSNVEALKNTYTIRLNSAIKKLTYILCDRFNYVPWDKFIADSVNYISHVSTNHIYITHNESASADAFKQYLQANPVAIITVLAEEKIFEVNPLFLDAYEGGTLIQVLSGTINADVVLKITSYISGLIATNIRRIKELENEVFKGQEAQNQIILENDMRIIDLEMALMDSMPMLAKVIGGENMQERSQLYFDFLKGRIESGNYTDEYLERVINKYLQGKRITQEEYDVLYDMIYPPVYDLPQE